MYIIIMPEAELPLSLHNECPANHPARYYGRSESGLHSEQQRQRAFWGIYKLVLQD